MTELEPSYDIDARVQCAVHAVLDRKAERLRVLELQAVCDFTDYFVICSGGSDRQVKAIVDRVVADLRDLGVRPLHLEGERNGRWVLIDYGDFIVHVFDPERRDFYRLEDIWSDAPELTSRFADERIVATTG